jgi:penicillin V acylase-like amidase (Ntn superfamily)
LSSRDEYGNYIFGRNFDWKNCNAMIVKAVPENGYTSISTVNIDFIGGVNFENLSDEIRTTIALYAPMDGMNEKGFVVSVNMIQDSATINQTTEKPDITTTTAIRMLLDFDYTEEFRTAVENNPVLEGWGNKIVIIDSVK